MYNRRLKIFILVFTFFLSICIFRLFKMQVFNCGDTREIISKIGVTPPKTLPTLRGSLLDRNGKELAIDKPAFFLNVKYDLTRLMDDRLYQANALIRAADKKEDVETARKYWEDYFSKDIERLFSIIDKCSSLPSVRKEDVLSRINEINDKIWNMRRYFAWKRNFPHSTDINDFDSLGEDEKLRLEGMVNDLAEMKTYWYELAELEKHEDIVAAQNQFSDSADVCIKAKSSRCYPYKNVASQIIGWVNPSKPDKKIFEEDDLASYMDDELAGYMGVEYVCEPLLRGRRGQIVYSHRDEEPNITPREFGQDVRLTIDIELEKRIGNFVTDTGLNPIANRPTGIVLIDAGSNEILAAVSTPEYDLSRMRLDFAKMTANPKKPLQSRAFYKLYPPGSSIKPFILAMGMEEGLVGPDTIINCPITPESNWPRCLLQRKYSCHDYLWENEGGNTGRNALRGSCNIYFTKLAHRMETRKLQKWLYDFGLGRKILQIPDLQEESLIESDKIQNRTLPESAGMISDKSSPNDPQSFDEIPLMSSGEKKWFGMGQGSLRVTVVQIANAYAALARGGIFETPVLYQNIDTFNKLKSDLHLKETTIKTVREGLYAVVNEPHGSAYKIFNNCELKNHGIKIYGKTGSTEGSINAWFGGFAEDKTGRSLAVAVVVEGGEHGSTDAAPIARKVFEICNDMGYIGTHDESNR